jgi:predicted transcriptional regulator
LSGDQRAAVDDPALAIGSAKELIESTAKVVLAERGQPPGDKAELPVLIKDAQKALAAHRSVVAPGPDSSEAFSRILGGVSNICRP